MNDWEARCAADGAILAAAPVMCQNEPDDAAIAEAKALGEALA